MKSKFLFPRLFRVIGFILALPGFVLGYLNVYQNFTFKGLNLEISYRDFLQSTSQPQTQNFTNEIALTLVVCGLLLIAFSRLKREDELTARLRLDALYWAILFGSILHIIYSALDISFWSNGISSTFFFSLLHVPLYAMFTPLMIFIIRFNYLINFKKEAYLISPSYYLPYYPFRTIGKWLSVSSVCLMILSNFEFGFIERVNDWSSMAYFVLHPSLLIWAYSKNADEDELTTHFRLESMQLSVYLNYGLLILANLTIFGISFLTVMQINKIAPLLFFIIIFNYISSKNYWQVRREVRGGLLS